MTIEQARERAARMGLSVWHKDAIKVGASSAAVTLNCVGFAGLEMPIAEAETWDEAFRETLRIIYRA